MSRSLRRTRTFRGKTTTATARTLSLSKRGPAGTAFPVSAPSQEAFRRHVLANICPFCGAGPFKALAIHTQRAHAVDRFELRELAGLLYSDSITSPEYHAERVSIAKETFAAGKTLKAEDVANGIRKKRKLSPAAREMQRTKSLAAHAADPDLARRASAAAKAKEAERLRPIYEQVVAVYEQVLADRGMAYGAVAETARRLGWPEPRTLRRIEAAWKLGMGTADRTIRGTSEDRICAWCGETYTVTRSAGWNTKTCSVACGARLNGERSKKADSEAECQICGTTFTYRRPGTAERKLCDDPACRSELSRRTQLRRHAGLSR